MKNTTLPALSYNESTFTVSLDISQAYDNVYIPALTNILLTLNIPKKFILYIHRWLINREITLVCNNTCITRVTSRGVPQGSVLSPLLFALYISQMNNCLTSQVKSLQYADDITIYCSNKCTYLAQTFLQNNLNKLTAHFESIHLQFNHTKCKAIFFSRKTLFDILQLTINNNAIEYCVMKYVYWVY